MKWYGVILFLGLTPFSRLVDCLVDRLLVYRDLFSRAVAKNIYIQLQEKVCEPFGITWISALITHKMWSDLHPNHNNIQTQCD
jgi:hypothetical protein